MTPLAADLPMPPQFLFSLDKLDLNTPIFGLKDIEDTNPQRGHMKHLDAVVLLEPDGIIGYKDVRADEFWVPGHIPGRPLLPGVIMIEAAAQAASFYTRRALGWQGFIGFGAVDAVKFRAPVPPGVRLHL
ncbi:MAG TPA: hypothetical protein PK402_13185, partial [Tepidisphaeraceae bacterium]|nr:hypothetical protein [Tepidisphaeraceae bacterium]